MQSFDVPVISGLMQTLKNMGEYQELYFVAPQEPRYFENKISGMKIVFDLNWLGP